MTLRQARKDFKEYILPTLDKSDKIAVNMYYMWYLDSLCKDGQITQRQYQNASNYF